MGDPKRKKIKLSTLLWTLAIFLAAYLVLIGAIIYFSPLTGKLMENQLIKKTAMAIPYPAALAGENMVSMGDLLENFAGMKKFYESQDFSILGMRVDFSTDNGKKRLRIKEKDILGKLIEDTIIKTEAKKRNIIITDAIIDQEVDRKLKEYGAENQLKDNLEKLYGWNIENFKENIVTPDLYKERLAQEIKKNNPSFAEAKEKITAAKKDLSGGSDFADVAKKYSQGESAENGGDLGWFNYNQMIPEVALAVFNLEKEQTSEIIESAIGYHIVRVADRKNENGEDKIKLSQIFIRTESFPEWLIKKEKEYRILIPLNEFRWNIEKGTVEFKNEDMRNFEKELLENNTSDPSLFF